MGLTDKQTNQDTLWEAVYVLEARIAGYRVLDQKELAF